MKRSGGSAIGEQGRRGVRGGRKAGEHVEDGCDGRSSEVSGCPSAAAVSSSSPVLTP